MDTFTQKTNEIIKQNAEIINNLIGLDANQFNSVEFEILKRSINLLAKSQTLVVKQIEQNAELLETLTINVNNVLNALNGKYKFL